MVPRGVFGQIIPRLTLDWMTPVKIVGPIVDKGFDENISFIVYNLGEEDLKIKKGSFIVHFIPVVVSDADMIRFPQPDDEIESESEGEDGPEADQAVTKEQDKEDVQSDIELNGEKIDNQ